MGLVGVGRLPAAVGRRYQVPDIVAVVGGMHFHRIQLRLILRRGLGIRAYHRPAAGSALVRKSAPRGRPVRLGATGGARWGLRGRYGELAGGSGDG